MRSFTFAVIIALVCAMAAALLFPLLASMSAREETTPVIAPRSWELRRMQLEALGFAEPSAREEMVLEGMRKLLSSTIRGEKPGIRRLSFRGLDGAHHEAIVNCDSPWIEKGEAYIYRRVPTGGGRPTYYVRCTPAESVETAPRR